MKRIFAVVGTVFLMVLTACAPKVNGPKVNGIDDFINAGGIEVRVTRAQFATRYTGMFPIGSFERRDTIAPVEGNKFLIISLEATNVGSVNEVYTALKINDCINSCFQIKASYFEIVNRGKNKELDRNNNAHVDIVMTVDANMGNSVFLTFWDGTEIPLQKLLSNS